jgi:hypothetical protein
MKRPKAMRPHSELRVLLLLIVVIVGCILAMRLVMLGW